MPRRCIIPNCLSNSSSKHSRAAYVSTFLFPTEEQKLKLWLDLINASCNSEITEVTKASGICIKHFEDKYIVTEAQATRPDGSILSVPLKRPRLAADAVPTVFYDEKDFILTSKTTKRKFVQADLQGNTKQEKEELQNEVFSEPPFNVVSVSLKKPARPRTASSITVSGTYIIKAEIIKPGPRLIFDESISRVEYDKKQSEHSEEDDEQGADDVVGNCVKEEQQNVRVEKSEAQ